MVEKMTIFLSFAFIIYTRWYATCLEIETDELVMIPLLPTSFNWSSTPEGEYIYVASLSGLPDLPEWIQLTYNKQMKAGFLFGTPPAQAGLLNLDVVAINQETFESAVINIPLNISLKTDVPRRTIRMKIHNLNVDDMMDPSKQSSILDIFRSVLWQESASDIHFMELNSALLFGGRRPIRPKDGEGVIFTLGSRMEFSETLRELEREVSPLWTFPNCPRNFKKTSVERYFRSQGLIVDWCSFRLSPENTALVTSTPTSETDSRTENSNSIKHNKVLLDEVGLWRAPARWELPRRNYTTDGLVAIFIPLMALLVLTGLLTAVVGVHPEGKEAQEDQLYEGVFEEMPCLKNHMEGASRRGRLNSTKTTKSVQELRESATPSLNRLKTNVPFDLSTETCTRGSSPFVVTSTSPSPTPGSTLSRAANTPHSTLAYSERTSTLGRREPPPYGTHK